MTTSVIKPCHSTFRTSHATVIQHHIPTDPPTPTWPSTCICLAALASWCQFSLYVNPKGASYVTPANTAFCLKPCRKSLNNNTHTHTHIHTYIYTHTHTHTHICVIKYLLYLINYWSTKWDDAIAWYGILDTN